MAELSNQITFVIGPTASGKSSWALSEALSTGGAIVNADSVQVYSHLHIGAAKPSAEDLKKVPHYLYGIASPIERFTAGDYRRAALDIIEKKINTQPLFFVGGSGFYIQALEKGMFDVAPISLEILNRVEEMKLQNRLFEELKSRDMAAATKIGRTDPYRLQRALELVISEGRPLQQIKAEFEAKNEPLKSKYKIRKIGIRLDREILRKRVVVRTEAMIKQGLIEEVESLIKLRFQDTKALRSVGYKEVLAFLSGQLKRDQLLGEIVTSTMQLAKRQMTWFKRDREIEWLSPYS